MKFINGTALAKTIRVSVKEAVLASGKHPALATILVGDNPSSQIYLRLKERACNEVGIRFERRDFPDTATETELLAHIRRLNTRPDIHGILVQLPFPDGLNPDPVIAAMDPKKDVDGFHPVNLAAIDAGCARTLPVLVKTVLALLEQTQVPIAGTTILLLSKSDVFTRPFRNVLTKLGATVIHAESPDMQQMLKADILITALGRPHSITGEMVKDGATIIDIGITPTEYGVQGDVDEKSVAGKAAWLTPVPGGVGPVTVAMLLENVALAAGLALSARNAMRDNR